MALTPARLLANDGVAVHVRHKHVGNPDGAVGLLIVFQNCEIGSANGEAPAVEGVHIARLSSDDRYASHRSRLVLGLVADVGAAGMEGFEIRAGADLAVELLTGEPDF